MLASRPAIPSIQRLPAPTRIDGCACWSCITRSTVDESAGLSKMRGSLRLQLAFESSTGTRVDQRFMTRRHDRSPSRIDFSRARSLRFARFIAPAIAGATMVPNPDGRPRLRSSTIVAPLGVSENV